MRQFQPDRTSAAARVPDLRVVPPSQPAPASERTYWLAFVCIMGLAVLIRAGFVLGSDFPLNDGGLFFQMTRDLQAAGYALPETASYNGGGIPFAYPPLGFYAAAALDDATPLSLIDAFRFLPLAGSVAALAAFVVLARGILPTRTHVLVAVTAFSMLPATFQWMIMGGGVTRSLGFAFALLAIAQMNRMYERPTLARALGAALLASAASLSHLEMGLVVAYSALVLFVAKGRTADGLRATIITGGATLLLTAPWWVTIFARHGIGTIVAAAQSGSPKPLQPLFLLLQFHATVEPYFPLLAALALLGIASLLARREFLLPAWLLVTAFLDWRAFPTSASFLIAMLVACAVVDVMTPMLRHGWTSATGAASRGHGAPGWLLPSACALGLIYVTFSAVLTTPRLLTGMSADERSAMDWARTNLPASSRVVIVSGEFWPIDRTAEWFPALTGHVSVATVQGQEWIGDGAFARKAGEYDELQDCALRDVTCLEAWATDTGNTYDYVYIPKIPPRYAAPGVTDCCSSLLAFLAADDGYELLYDGPGAVIYRRK